MTPLEKEIRELIAYEGRITFERFMRLALYHPTLGYYRRQFDPVGRGGDFVTAPEISSAFGACLARAIAASWEAMGRPKRFSILEFGAGSGFLAARIMQALSERHPELCSAATYTVCEQNYRIRSAIKPPESFLRTKKYRALSFHEIPGERVSGCIISNEFFDAFSVHRLRCIRGVLAECYIDVDEKGLFRESFDVPSWDFIGKFWERYGIALAENQEAEISLKALEAFDVMANILEEGSIITVDYGDVAERLYSAHPQGTLMTYRQQRADADYYSLVGEKDITAHVNFAALMRRGEELGYKNALFTTQARFLTDFGIADEMPAVIDTVEAANLSQQIKQLLSPSAMGERFKVLVQKKM
ncbi:MAG: SAM-dependent methyltransferase [bacterium]|nr:SAM-dependent methyltransferase [bacterium]